MKIYYGITNNLKDVTEICMNKLTHNNIINIPAGDHTRSSFFNDHLVGTVKKIIVENNDIMTEYNHDTQVKIDITNNNIEIINNDDINNKTKEIHSKLKINYGYF